MFWRGAKPPESGDVLNNMKPRRGDHDFAGGEAPGNEYSRKPQALKGRQEDTMSFTRLNYHIVFSTKEREPWLEAEVMHELAPYLGGVLKELGGALLAANGPFDHIHLAAILKPTVTVADTIGKVKTSSTKWIKHRFRRAAFAWQEGYAAFTVSYSGMSRVTGYIRRQIEHHRKQPFLEELKTLLKRHRIPFDEKYLL